MKFRNFIITGLSLSLTMWSCSAFVDVEENSPEAGCIGCHSNADALKKYTAPDEAAAAGGG